jgi:hypothetical protein
MFPELWEAILPPRPQEAVALPGDCAFGSRRKARKLLTCSVTDGNAEQRIVALGRGVSGPLTAGTWYPAARVRHVAHF